MEAAGIVETVHTNVAPRPGQRVVMASLPCGGGCASDALDGIAPCELGSAADGAGTLSDGGPRRDLRETTGPDATPGSAGDRCPLAVGDHMVGLRSARGQCRQHGLDPRASAVLERLREHFSQVAELEPTGSDLEAAARVCRDDELAGGRSQRGALLVAQ